MLPLQKAKVFKKVKKRAIGYSLFCRTASRLPGISGISPKPSYSHQNFSRHQVSSLSSMRVGRQKTLLNIEIDDAYFGGKKKG